MTTRYSAANTIKDYMEKKVGSRFILDEGNKSTRIRDLYGRTRIVAYVLIVGGKIRVQTRKVWLDMVGLPCGFSRPKEMYGLPSGEWSIELNDRMGLVEVASILSTMYIGIKSNLRWINAA